MTHSLALITGASRGLGAALAAKLAKRKIPLCLVARNEEELKALAQELGKQTQVTVLALDLLCQKDRAILIRFIHEKAPDLLINNAGIGLYGEALFHSTEESLKIIELNITALTELSLEAARTLAIKKKTGVILNIASAAAFFPMPELNIYAASKAYVKAFSLALDAELKPLGIRVLTACPGQIRTSFSQHASLGKKLPPSSRSLPVEKAADLLLKQIDKKNAISIFPLIDKIGILFSLFIPRKYLFNIFRNEIKTYHSLNKIYPLK